MTIEYYKDSAYLLYNNDEIDEDFNASDIFNKLCSEDYIEVENDYSVANYYGYDNCTIFHKITNYIEGIENV